MDRGVILIQPKPKQKPKSNRTILPSAIDSRNVILRNSIFTHRELGTQSGDRRRRIEIVSYFLIFNLARSCSLKFVKDDVWRPLKTRNVSFCHLKIEKLSGDKIGNKKCSDK